MKKKIWAIMVAISCYVPMVHAQIVADTNLTPLQLVQSFAGNGVTISNVTYTGSNGAKAYYTNTGFTMPADTGIFLTTGNTLSLAQNSHFTTSSNNQTPGDLQLANYFGVPDTTLFDAAILEFDMQVASDSFEFSFFFASEEYSDYVNTAFFDGFAVFLDSQNVALVPGTVLPITINSINNGQSNPFTPTTGPCMNCVYFNDNWNWNAFVFDGYTTLLTMRRYVTAMQTYHMKIVISDLGDIFFDTAVFLKAGSLQIATGPGLCTGYNVTATPSDTTVCQDSLQLNAIASIPASTYTWSPATGLSDPSIANPIVNYAFNQQYVVTATDTVTGCIATDTVDISVYNDYSINESHCSPDTVTFTLPAGANSYDWISFDDIFGNSFPLSDTTQSIQANLEGTYIGTAMFNGCSVNGNFILTDSCNINPYVWPGDCNYDLVANNIDFLYVGLAYLSLGSWRQTVSNAWQPWLSYNWSNNFINGANYKHADSNGDGAVEIIDTAAISQNYSLTHPPRQPAPEYSSLNSDLRILANKDTAGLNEWIYFDLIVGGAQPVDSLYGLVYTLNFDQTLLDLTQTSISYTPSVLGTINSDMYPLTMNFSSVGRIEAALCRFDQTNALNVNGSLGTIAVKTAGNITMVSLLPMVLSDVHALTTSQSQVLFNLIPDTVVIDPNYLSVEEHDAASIISIYPNPVSNFVFVMSGNKALTNYVYTIFNMQGAEVSKGALHSNGIDINNLPNQVYFIRLELSEGPIMKRFVKM